MSRAVSRAMVCASCVQHQFSTKSDVWSFAVTLWEILTFARQRPFDALADEQVLDNCARCCAGHQLDVVLGQPANCPREIYDLMVECWNRVELHRYRQPVGDGRVDLWVLGFLKFVF